MAGCQAARIILNNRIFWIESCVTEAWSELTLIICVIRYCLCTDYNKIIEEDNFHIGGVFDSIPRVSSLNNTFTYVYQRFWLHINKQDEQNYRVKKRLQIHSNTHTAAESAKLLTWPWLQFTIFTGILRILWLHQLTNN